MATKIKTIDLREVCFTIQGVTPLIQHAWSEKGKRQMRMTAPERKKQEKTKRNPTQSAQDATYFMPDTNQKEYAFPLLAFKSALIASAHKDLGIEKTLLRKSFFIPDVNREKLVPLTSDAPEIREDVVKVGINQTDLRYRPEFKNWSVDITAHVDFGALNEGNLINLINRAGFGTGVGEMRPERGGEYGRFKLDTSKGMQISPMDW